MAGSVLETDFEHCGVTRDSREHSEGYFRIVPEDGSIEDGPVPVLVLHT